MYFVRGADLTQRESSSSEARGVDRDPRQRVLKVLMVQMCQLTMKTQCGLACFRLF